MGRIRTIKPEFPQSEKIGRLSREARLCFVMMWTIADDAGRLRGSSRMLASLLYPYDDDAAALMDGWVAELETFECIRRYEVNGSSYIQIANWLEHQKIDKPSASKIPAFDDHSTKPREASTTDLGPGPSIKEEEQKASHPGRHERFGEVMKRVESILNCPSLTVFAEIDQWLKGGADPDADIYPTLERLKSKWSGPSLRYFTQAIADSVATRKTPLPQGVPRFQGKTQAPELTADEKARAAELGRKTRLELAKKGISSGANTPQDFDAWIASGQLTEDQARSAGWSGPRRRTA